MRAGTNEVESRLKEDSYGLCGCEHDLCTLRDMGNYRLGKPDKNGRRHARGCECPSCRGRRNRTKGDREARRARKALAIPGANSRHEEVWAGALRVEMKAGKQVAPAVTAYKRCEAQSEAQRPVGDNRPFVAVWMPDGESDGYVAFRLSAIFDVATAILENQAAS